MAEEFKTVAERALTAHLIQPATSETALPRHSTDNLDLMNLPARLDDTLLARVEAIARAGIPELPPCDEVHFARTMRAMDSSLPKRSSDDASGELMLAVYRKRLGEYPREAINHMFNRAIDTCRWFPTVAECLELLAEWERSDPHTWRRNKAKSRAAWERETRMRDAMMELAARAMPQVEIDALPEYWRKIAVERGYLRMDGEQFVARPDR